MKIRWLLQYSMFLNDFENKILLSFFFLRCFILPSYYTSPLIWIFIDLDRFSSISLMPNSRLKRSLSLSYQAGESVSHICKTCPGLIYIAIYTIIYFLDHPNLLIKSQFHPSSHWPSHLAALIGNISNIHRRRFT